MVITKELVSRQRPFAGMNDYQVLLAIIQGETPSFPPRSKNELNMIRDMLEKLCRRCWASNPAHRPTMHDIIGDLRPETWFLQEDQSLTQHVYNAGMSNLEMVM